jgi:translation initiation factor 2 beta subunit (eIF-2beta)/eIF-5
LGAVDNSDERARQQNSKSLHQKRYDVIREYMDNASTNFMKQQERTKRYNEFLERQKKAQEAKEAQEADKKNSI